MRVLDGAGFPVPDLPVTFEVVMGGGSLDGQEGPARIHTDGDGMASVPFRLGAKPGFQSVEASVEGLKVKAVFEAMGSQ